MLVAHAYAKPAEATATCSPAKGVQRGFTWGVPNHYPPT
jgi:hypothetical protein